MDSPSVVVVGLGEVGKPLYQILNETYRCIAVDIERVDIDIPVTVLHICIPFGIDGFINTAVGYIGRYKPQFTIINSTVAPGTTRRIADLSRSPVAYSPVRGKHVKMEDDLRVYKKFVGADDPETMERAVRHFENAGFNTSTFPTSKVGEVAKLMETTWLGVLVAWAQEVERIGMQFGAAYADINSFIEEIDFLPHHIFPGYIGGHCVMPNIHILQSQVQSEFLDVIVNSNNLKKTQTESDIPDADMRAEKLKLERLLAAGEGKR